MPSTSQIAELTRTVDDVLTVARADVRALTSTVVDLSPPAATATLTAEVPPLVQAWGDVSSTVAADWYSLTRPDGPPFTPTVAPAAPVEQIEAMVRWAVGPLWQAYDWDAALRDLLAGSGRLVRQSSRDTIERNAWDDPASGAFVRVARPDACPWCLMLASRGAVYRSAETAGATRGFHDSCRCTVSPVYDDDDVPDMNRRLAAEWKQATRGRRDQLAAWSEHIAATRGT